MGDLELALQVDRDNCEIMIPTGWNIYEWAEQHPETTVAHSIKRIEKVFDFSNSIQCGFSGGKDSTLSANLSALELNRRRLRVAKGIDRDGNSVVDPLDEKWAHKRINMAMTDAEVVFSFTNDYAKRFIERNGPRGFDLIEFNWICLPLSWQSGVSFDSGILVSWDKDKENIWVQPMPTREDLFGFDCLNEGNLSTANPVLLSSLSEEAQEWHRANDNVVMVEGGKIFRSESDTTELVEAVANFGRGKIDWFVKGMHEKDQQDAYSYWSQSTTWLVAGANTSEIQEAIERRHDISKDVWFLRSSDEKGAISSALISLRAEESLDRRVILSQGEYSTGQYSNNQGVNICSPVFDYTVYDVWRVLAKTDWDVNEVYEKLYEIGVGVADQRVGSLLNYAAVRSISTVKALEPELYGRINGRFQNVEFMSQFSRSGYFRIGKPKDVNWDGQNHVKAGHEPEEITALSDRYEAILQKLDTPYTREENVFRSADPAFKGKPWFPLKKFVKV